MYDVKKKKKKKNGMLDGLQTFLFK